MLDGTKVTRLHFEQEMSVQEIAEVCGAKRQTIEHILQGVQTPRNTEAARAYMLLDSMMLLRGMSNTMLAAKAGVSTYFVRQWLLDRYGVTNIAELKLQ